VVQTAQGPVGQCNVDPAADLAFVYENACEQIDADYLQNLALFTTTFVKNHMAICEDPSMHQALLHQVRMRLLLLLLLYLLLVLTPLL